MRWRTPTFPSRTSPVVGLMRERCFPVHRPHRGSISFPKAVAWRLQDGQSYPCCICMLWEASLPPQVRAVMSNSEENGLPRALACPAQTEQGSTTLGQTPHPSLETSRLLQFHPPTLTTSGGSLDNVVWAGFRPWAMA